jgi:hypothetical protein
MAGRYPPEPTASTEESREDWDEDRGKEDDIQASTSVD